MGIKRFLKKCVVGGGNPVLGHFLDAAQESVKSGKSYADCLRKSVKETITEDLPGSRDIYQAGHAAGKREGTVEQSKHDSKKMRCMRKKFRNQCRDWKDKEERYKELLNDAEEELRKKQRQKVGDDRAIEESPT